MTWIEITQKFTTSEMAIMSWSSREQAYSLGEPLKENKENKVVNMQEFLDRGVANPDAMEQVKGSDYSMTRGPVESVPAEDVDMRQYTGKQLWKYFQSQGMVFPIIAKDRD